MAPDLARRYARLEAALRKLRRYAGRARSADTLRRDDELQDLVARNFQIAVEALIDVASSLIAARGLRPPDSAADAFSVLCEAGLLPARQAEVARLWVGFRNVLVHEYAGIDWDIVHQALSADLDRLAELARHLGTAARDLLA